MSALRAIGGKCRALMAAVPKSSSTSTPKSVGSKKVKRPSTIGSTPTGILKPVPVSPTLANFLGANEASRTEAVKKIWDYIKTHNLQNPENKKEILCDEKLKMVFNGKDTVDFLEIAKLLSQHFIKSG